MNVAVSYPNLAELSAQLKILSRLNLVLCFWVDGFCPVLKWHKEMQDCYPWIQQSLQYPEWWIWQDTKSFGLHMGQSLRSSTSIENNEAPRHPQT